MTQSERRRTLTRGGTSPMRCEVGNARRTDTALLARRTHSRTSGVPNARVLASPSAPLRGQQETEARGSPRGRAPKDGRGIPRETGGAVGGSDGGSDLAVTPLASLVDPASGIYIP